VVIERKAVAEAKGQEAKAIAIEKQGIAEATVIEQKYMADANGITEKAKAMKIFNEAGKEHEEFKIRLGKDKDVELAAIDAQRQIAEQQAGIVGKALESARIDIVGGETEFFDRITNAIASGKTVDRWVGNSQVLGDIKSTFFNGEGEFFEKRLREFVAQFKIGSEDIKNLSIAALIGKMTGMTDDKGVLKELKDMLGVIRSAGLSDTAASSLKLK